MSSLTLNFELLIRPHDQRGGLERATPDMPPSHIKVDAIPHSRAWLSHATKSLALFPGSRIADLS